MNKKYIILFAGLLPVFAACSQAQTTPQPDTAYSQGAGQDAGQDAGQETNADTPKIRAQLPYAQVRSDGLSTAIFAGGCFWCTESDFEKLPGVVEAISGYTGGAVDNPNYKQVSYTETGHFEAVKVVFDPSQVSYRELVDTFWLTIDPTDARGQFCDKGSSYRSAIFATPEQIADAKASKAQIIETKPFEADIVTPVLEAKTFYDAEGYHQDYYKTNSVRYKIYRNGCGRDRRLNDLWGDR